MNLRAPNLYRRSTRNWRQLSGHIEGLSQLLDKRPEQVADAGEVYRKPEHNYRVPIKRCPETTRFDSPAPVAAVHPVSTTISTLDPEIERPQLPYRGARRALIRAYDRTAARAPAEIPVERAEAFIAEHFLAFP